jgi:hypothetical protein
VPKEKCLHSWVAGMMRVHDEDLLSVVSARSVECEKCELIIYKGAPDKIIFALMYGEE